MIDMKKTIGLLLCSGVLFVSCSKSTDTATGGTGGGSSNCTTAPKFAADASPVFQSKCATNASCHASGSSNNGGVLVSHAQINSKKATIVSQVNSGAMPRGGTLTAAEKTAIVCWIEAGAMNN